MILMGTAGRSIPLSLPRRWIIDLMHFAQQVPTIPVQRRIDISAIVAGRRAANPRPSWTAMFAKSYAIVAARRPELRRCYLPLPWPHLYEHPVSVATIAVEREYEGENAVFFAHVRIPEERSLLELDTLLRHWRSAPLRDI